MEIPMKASQQNTPKLWTLFETPMTLHPSDGLDIKSLDAQNGPLPLLKFGHIDTESLNIKIQLAWAVGIEIHCH